jgi:uncharacterized phosphosugar-binding protein
MAIEAALDYYRKTAVLLEQLKDTQQDAIDRAAAICTHSIANGGLVFLFGNGHSRMMCEEMTPRQGCFVGFVAMVELALSNHASIVGSNGLRHPLYLEKYEGYAEEILKSFHFGPHDSLIVISTSGIRPVVVEMAEGGKRRGMPVIGICSRAHSASVPAAHSSGQKLADVADVLIDNLCPIGDCVHELPGMDWRTGPTSTVTGAMIINMLRCEVADRLIARGIQPTILPSHQLPGNTKSADALEAFYEGYRKSLKHLYE